MSSRDFRIASGEAEGEGARMEFAVTMLLAQFDGLIQTPADVAKLNGAILQWAVAGRLVPQCADDEPAKILLERIEEERKELIAKEEIRNPKPLKSVDDSNLRRLPNGWKWIRLGQIVLDDKGGKTPSKRNHNYWGGSVYWASVKDLNVDRLISTQDTITEQALEDTGVPLIPKGNIIVCVRMGLGKIVVNDIDVAINQDLRALFLASELDKSYFVKWFQTLQLSGSGMTVKGIKREDLLNLQFPLPPLAEQKRIVARVDALLGQTAVLAQQLAAIEEERRGVNTAVLHQLTSATSQTSEVLKTSEVLMTNFDRLYVDGAMIDELKQAILQTAVQGRLVPQDPDDEPASVLLERIEAEKEALIKAGKLKKEKKLTPISEEKIPYNLPKGWVWARLPELGELNRGKSKHRPRNAAFLYEDGIYPFVQTGEVARSNGYVRLYSQMYSEKGLAQSRLWPKGTLCITIAANIAETGILDFDACFPDSVVGFIPSSLINSAEYFQFFVQVAKKQLEEYAPATAQKNINLGILKELLIPTPPVNELHRIVAKVDELFALCDQLAGQVTAAETSREQLLTAILAQAG